jgi:hypothetical protein
MLTLEDCIALSGLTEAEIDAIAEHEHLPEILAAELGFYLVQDDKGVPRLKRMILEDIEAAERKGNERHAEKLRRVLRHFIRTHPGRKSDSAA